MKLHVSLGENGKKKTLLTVAEYCYVIIYEHIHRFKRYHSKAKQSDQNRCCVPNDLTQMVIGD